MARGKMIARKALGGLPARYVFETPISLPRHPQSSPAKTHAIKRKTIDKSSKKAKDTVSRANSSTSSSSRRSRQGDKEEEEQLPFGKIAASGHSDDYDERTAPEWACGKGKGWVGVYNEHHSVFDGEWKPKKRTRRVSASQNRSTPPHIPQVQQNRSKLEIKPEIELICID